MTDWIADHTHLIHWIVLGVFALVLAVALIPERRDDDDYFF